MNAIKLLIIGVAVVFNNKTVLVIKKEWIETNDIQDTLELIGFLNTDSSMQKRFAGQLELSFKEWDDEPLERWNTKAIASWLHRLVSGFPYLITFLDRSLLSNRLALHLLSKGAQAFSSANRIAEPSKSFYKVMQAA